MLVRWFDSWYMYLICICVVCFYIKGDGQWVWWKCYTACLSSWSLRVRPSLCCIQKNIFLSVFRRTCVTERFQAWPLATKVLILENLCDREVSSLASCYQSLNSVSEGKCYLIYFTIITMFYKPNLACMYIKVVLVHSLIP